MIKPSHYPKIKVIYILLLTTAWSLYVYYKGVMISPDGIRYSLFADILIEHNFSFLKYLELATFPHYPPLFNYNWVVIVAVIKLLFGENWALGIVILNLLIGIFFATLLLKTTWVATEKPACVIFAGILLFLGYDFYLWIPWALSDIFFACLCFAILLLTVGLYQQRSEPLKRVFGIGVLFCFALLCRPAFPPLLIFVILSMPMFFFFSMKATDARERHSFIIRLTLLAGILIPVTIIFH
ncbi:hypothetical protein N9L33_06665, partial [Nitrospinae bacterium]|nr:hypothetical protein [Nitrospinota bacterium]